MNITFQVRQYIKVCSFESYINRIFKKFVNIFKIRQRRIFYIREIFFIYIVKFVLFRFINITKVSVIYWFYIIKLYFFTKSYYYFSNIIFIKSVRYNKFRNVILPNKFFCKRLGITVFQPRLKVCTFARTNYYEYGKQRQVQESA